MKLGFLTACLPRLPLAELVPWAAAHGFRALEVSCWPPDAEPHDESPVDQGLRSAHA